jgi:hypothetical protein
MYLKVDLSVSVNKSARTRGVLWQQCLCSHLQLFVKSGLDWAARHVQHMLERCLTNRTGTVAKSSVNQNAFCEFEKQSEEFKKKVEKRATANKHC